MRGNISKTIAVSGLIIISSYTSAWAVSSPTTTPPIKSGYHINKNYDLVPNDNNGNKNIVLITIDDGPTKRTPGMMETLKKHNAKAIFFINGIHHKDFPHMIADEAKQGFTIGNHTWSHINLKKEKKNSKIDKEINDTSKLILEQTGQSPRFFRSPYGMGSTYAKELVKKSGMISMNWSGSALDWESSTKNEEVFLKNVLNTIHPGEILLLHEHPWTAKHLDALLTAIEKKGYTFADPSQITQ